MTRDDDDDDGGRWSDDNATTTTKHDDETATTSRGQGSLRVVFLSIARLELGALRGELLRHVGDDRRELRLLLAQRALRERGLAPLLRSLVRDEILTRASLHDRTTLRW